MFILDYQLGWNLFHFICPRDGRSGGKLFLSCLLFCHSVILSFYILSEPITLLISFQPRVLEFWYFTLVFIVTDLFSGAPTFLDSMTLTLKFDTLFENFNLSNNWNSVRWIIDITHEYSFREYQHVYPLSLILEFNLWKKGAYCFATAGLLVGL